ncbi:MAG: hypothetical protein VYE51_04315, partial [Candidatus Thermoplasmatota archaeon]|nr:hypothetical protein [Candidatus Thermoplasmatota archaeon]
MSDSNIDSSETEELSDEIDSPDEENSSDTTNWADSGNSGSEICTIPVEDWVENLSVGPNSFESTEDVPLPNRL